MNRRRFLKTSIATTTATWVTMNPEPVRAAPAPALREVYELETYSLRPGTMSERFDEFYRDVAVVAWNRAGVRPVGVFRPADDAAPPSRAVLLPFPDWPAARSCREKFEADPLVAQAGFSRAPATDPGFIRKESSFLLAFAGLPRIAIPAQTRAGKPRLFELRTYESHSRRANQKKVAMFNEGEIAIFQRTGLQPVFFGEAWSGPQLPKLTYLLVFDDRASRDRNWQQFVADPDWKKMSTTPGYTDAEIVSHITNVFLHPTSYSQI